MNSFWRVLSGGLILLAGFVASSNGQQPNPLTPQPLNPSDSRTFREVRNCAMCHPAQAKPQPGTSMAHATETVAECGVLRSHPLLAFRSGGYSYKIERKGDESIYTVTQGTDTLSISLKYAVGLGSAGQTYVFEKDGALYESLVSYFRAIDSLDVTLGDQNIRPTSLLEAAGRQLGTREATLCLNCHASNALVDSKLSLATLVPGVQCERCHGDTRNHLEGLRKGDATLFAMKDLRGMSAEDAAHYCGQCHRTWEQIASNGPRGTANVRFQPYRLTNSRCFDADDKRISCLACHDPHQEVDRISQHYDSKCIACHGGGKPAAKACPVSASNCASCHMPKTELVGGHHKFTDHEIRVVRQGAPYPD
ncbi:MAG: hypothetical protein JOY62_10310 [Acidobacteriaceae bacterium]|nr:hypothetical protein [Acidobacteriaceae bacterium]MBV9780352.1 hypothetical protein [Acidobacteriaceae bacterium]